MSTPMITPAIHAPISTVTAVPGVMPERVAACRSTAPMPPASPTIITATTTATTSTKGVAADEIFSIAAMPRQAE